MFKWLFGAGDEVEDKDGTVYRVKDFGSEGYVNVVERGTETGQGKFGGGLRLLRRRGDNQPRQGRG